MINILVIYGSKYGSSERYAHMIEKNIKCKTVKAESITSDMIKSACMLIFIGGIYAGKLKGLDALHKKIHLFNGNKVILIAVGASPYDESAVKHLREKCTKGFPEGTAFFYARGSYNEKGMTFTDRTMCRMLRKSISKKAPDELEPWMIAMLEAGENSCSWVNESYLQPVYTYIKAAQ